MPLELLLVLVIGGIAGIAVLLHGLGFSRTLTFQNEAAAEAAWLRAYPDDKVTGVTLSDSRSIALIESVEGGGIVTSFGADSVAHRGAASANLLTRATLTQTERDLWHRKLQGTS